MKTLNFKLSKRLNEAWILDDIETEETIFVWWKAWEDFIKTLTLEEAIDFLPKTIQDWDLYWLQINWQSNWEYWIRYNNYAIRQFIHVQHWKTLLESIEKMLEYLLDNNLLTNKKNAFQMRY